MAIESISNTAAYADYKQEQKTSPVTAVNSANPAGSEGIGIQAAKKIVEKQDGTREEEKQNDAQANVNRVKSILNETNNKIRPARTRCEFSYHDKVNRVSIKVMDIETNEVIREIPPEETLEMLQKLWEVAGLLVDERR